MGAQVFPAPNVVLEPGVLASFVGANRVVYAAGLPGERVLVIQITPS